MAEVERTLEGTHPQLARFHKRHGNFTSVTQWWNEFPIYKDVVQATLELNQEVLNIKPRDFSDPLRFLEGQVKFRGLQFVLDLLNFTIDNRLYGKKVDDDEDDDNTQLSEKARRRRARYLEAEAKRRARGSSVETGGAGASSDDGGRGDRSRDRGDRRRNERNNHNRQNETRENRERHERKDDKDKRENHNRSDKRQEEKGGKPGRSAFKAETKQALLPEKN